MSAGDAGPRPGSPAPVPLIDLGPQYREIAADIEAAVLEVLRSQRYVLGEHVARFERELARFLGVPHAIGVASGSDALLLALMALEVRPGDEVITSPFSFFATAAAIVRLGAVPVFADISPLDYALDPDAASRAVSARTRVLLPVHLYGQCADLESLDAIAKRHRLALVEDAAQAIGASRSGHAAGAFGDLSCFSFYPTKNLSAAGDAGLVATSQDRLAERLRLLRDHGAERRYEHAEVGINSRLDAIQAAVLGVKLRHLERWNEDRVRAAGLYAELFRGAGLDSVLALPAVAPGARHVFHQYVVRVPDRARLRQHLEARGVGSEVYYPVPLHLQKCFAGLGYRRGDLPEAEKAADEVLALPLFTGITPAQQERVVKAIAEFFV